MDRRIERRRGIGAFARATALAVVACPRLAPADPPIVHAETILFEPGNPSHIVVRANAWGLFDSRDAGRTWSLYCSEVFGESSRHDTVPVVVTAGGRIIAAAGFLGMHASDDGCTWRALAPFEREPAMAITPADAAGKVFFAATTRAVDGGVRAILYRSADRGDTWSQVGDLLPDDIAVQSVAVAPGDPRRLYVAGWRIDIRASALLSSGDAGASWEVRPVPNEDPAFALRILAVHPSQPNALLLRLVSSSLVGIPALPDQLWATADGGASWTTPYLPRGALPGFAIDADAARVLIAGPDDGLLEAPVGDGFAGPFHLVSDSRIWGLGTSQGKLYAGHDDFTWDKTPENFALGVSSDRGAHFAPVMHLCDLGSVRCPAGSTVDTQCTPLLESRYLGPPPEDCTATGGATSRDPPGNGGASGTTGTSPGAVDGSVGAGGERVNRADSDQVESRSRITKVGCGCSTGDKSHDGAIKAFAVWAAAIAGLRRRRPAGASRARKARGLKPMPPRSSSSP